MLEWIPEPERSYLLAAVQILPKQVPTIQKIILFGSMARGTIRPMTDADPSDIDIIVLVSKREPEVDDAIFKSFGDLERHYHIERDQHTLVDESLHNWRAEFIHNVLAEGIVLYDAVEHVAVA